MTDTACYHNEPIRVLIVNDQLSVQWVLERLIESAGGSMAVAGTVSTMKEAMDRAGAASPDVILLDIDPRQTDAIAALPDLVACSAARVLAITGSRERAIREGAVLAGASGVVGKEEAPMHILRAIEKVSAGELWLDRSSAGRVFVQLTHRTDTAMPARRRRTPRPLSPRERDILRTVVEEPGVRLRGIAERHRISESTLRNHLTSIYGKLGVASRLELCAYAGTQALPD